MSASSNVRVARVTKWGIAGLLIFAGAMFLRTRWSESLPVADVALYLAAIGLGVALLLNWWLARWLVLGVCFLLIVAACVVPLLVFMRQPEGTSSGAVFFNALKAVFMIVLGGIAYRGLSYFRSGHGRREYAGSPEREERLMKEQSSAVVYSAGVWALLLTLAYFGGMTVPVGLVTTEDENRMDARRVAPVRSPDQPVASDAEPLAAPEAESLPPHAEDVTGPDVAPLGLCRAGDSWIGLAFVNHGRPMRSYDVGVSYNDSVWDPNSRASFTAKLPAPGGVTTAALGSTGAMIGEEGMRNVIRIELDPANWIRESDERNNSPEYPIDWDIFAKLPGCDSMRAVQR